MRVSGLSWVQFLKLHTLRPITQPDVGLCLPSQDLGSTGRRPSLPLGILSQSAQPQGRPPLCAGPQEA